MEFPGVKKNITSTVTVQKTPSANNSWVLALLLLIASGALYMFLLKPKLADLASVDSQKDSLSSQESTLFEQMNTLKKLAGELQDHKDDNQALDQALPLNGKTFDLQIMLQNLAASVGVTLNSLSIGSGNTSVIAGNTSLLQNPYATTRTLHKIAGSIYVSGSFDQLEVFLKKVESSERIMDINDLEITPDQNNTLGLKLSINAYYLAP